MLEFALYLAIFSKKYKWGYVAYAFLEGRGGRGFLSSFFGF